jgi:hypothetical protein
LCNNNLSLSLGDLKSLQDLKHYKSGGIYYAVNNPNINVLCITLDDFINNSFNYDWDFICQNTSKIFYVFKSESTNDKKCFDTLQKFYHKFNKHWCGKDLDYADNYDSYGKQISENDFKGPVLKKGKNDWFEYVRTKRNLFNHRYIFFLLDSDKIDYSFDFGQYVANMPDARSITLCKLEDELCIKPLINLLFAQSYEGFQKVKPFLKQEKNWSPLKIGLITVGGIGAIGTVAAISSLIKKNLNTKPKITKPEVKNQEVKNPGNNKLLT